MIFLSFCLYLFLLLQCSVFSLPIKKSFKYVSLPYLVEDTWLPSSILQYKKSFKYVSLSYLVEDNWFTILYFKFTVHTSFRYVSLDYLLASNCLTFCTLFSTLQY